MYVINVYTYYIIPKLFTIFFALQKIIAGKFMSHFLLYATVLNLLKILHIKIQLCGLIF